MKEKSKEQAGGAREVFGAFSNLENEIMLGIENKTISENLIKACEESKDLFIKFEDEFIKEEDILIGLKLFSASSSCALILEKAIPDLTDAKIRGENPISLEKMEDILAAVSQIGEYLYSIIDSPKSKSFMVRQIREISFYLQESAENIGLLEPIDKRISKTPYDLRKAIAGRITLHES